MFTLLNALYWLPILFSHQKFEVVVIMIPYTGDKIDREDNVSHINQIASN